MRDTKWAVHGGLLGPSQLISELRLRERVSGAHRPLVGFSES